MRLVPAVLACVLGLATVSARAQEDPLLSGTVTGHIFCGDNGLPARFATVQLQPDTAGRNEGSTKFDLMTVVFRLFSGGSGPSTLTQLDGSFRLDNVPPGVYYLVPQFSGYISPLSQLSSQKLILGSLDTSRAIEGQAQRIVVVSGRLSTVDIVLQRGASLSGQILYDDGSPAVKVQPLLLVKQKDGQWKKTKGGVLGGLFGVSSDKGATTDDRGQYRFTGLPPGEYAVMAELPVSQAVAGSGSLSVQLHFNDALQVYSGNVYSSSRAKGIDLTEGEEYDGMDIVFPVTGLHTVSGRVIAGKDAHPVSAGAIQIIDPLDKTVLRNAIALAPDGSFSFSYVPEGTYMLRVTGAGDANLAELARNTRGSAALFAALPSVASGLARELRRYADVDVLLPVQDDVHDFTIRLEN